MEQRFEKKSRVFIIGFFVISVGRESKMVNQYQNEKWKHWEKSKKNLFKKKFEFQQKWTIFGHCQNKEERNKWKINLWENRTGEKVKFQFNLLYFSVHSRHLRLSYSLILEKFNCLQFSILHELVLSLSVVRLIHTLLLPPNSNII